MPLCGFIERDACKLGKLRAGDNSADRVHLGLKSSGGPSVGATPPDRNPRFPGFDVRVLQEVRAAPRRSWGPCPRIQSRPCGASHISTDSLRDAGFRGEQDGLGDIAPVVVPRSDFTLQRFPKEPFCKCILGSTFEVAAGLAGGAARVPLSELSSPDYEFMSRTISANKLCY